MSEGKHLLVLHQAYVAGGAELTTKHMLAGIEREQFSRVSLICPQVMTDYWTQGYDQWIDSAPLCLAGWFDTPARLWRDAQALSRVLRGQKPTLAIGMMQYTSAVLALAIRMAGTQTRLLASYRGPAFEHLKHFEPSRWRRAWISTAICATSHAADAVTMPSQGTASELTRHCRVPARKMHIIYNGIDFEDTQRRCAQPIQLPLALCDGTPFAVIASRLSEEKRLDWVIQALTKIPAESPLKLLVLGDGSSRAELEALCTQRGVSERVIFLGHISDTLPYVARASMFIHTCQYEGFGYSILEALACGTPVIATDCPYGPREVLDKRGSEGLAGLLVPMNDDAALSTTMNQLSLNNGLRKKFIALGLLRAQELTLERMQTEHRRIMQNIIA